MVVKIDGKLEKKSDLASIDFALSSSGTSENGLIDTGFLYSYLLESSIYA
ncbi:Uncharacterised protein [Orientia tsutsugamushi]|nr:Uncharacterised protein [Orientia tsutsugamushi]